MFLSAYYFDGDPDQLTAAHARMLAAVDSIEVQICVRRDDGIVPFDTCPSREVFEQFSSSPGFGEMLASFGFPRPRVEPIGDIVAQKGFATGP